MAERMVLDMAKKLNLVLEAKSCGIATEIHFRVPNEIWRALAEKNIPPVEHRAQLVSRSLLEWADEVLIMTRRQRVFLTEKFPELGHKLHLLRERAGLSGDVADPMGKKWEDYLTCRQSIDEALDLFLRR
jgi:protein-tyrosine-phosphatase